MKDTGIVRLEDARALKQLGAPLNTPVEERTFSRDYSKHWFRLMKAHADFMIAVSEFSDGNRAGTIAKWRALKRRLKALEDEARRCDDFFAKLCGNPPPNFKTEQDEQEAAILQHFLVNRAVPFLEYWGRRDRCG